LLSASYQAGDDNDQIEADDEEMEAQNAATMDEDVIFV
jgi:hypothetical protein